MIELGARLCLFFRHEIDFWRVFGAARVVEGQLW
jgi:hypothetical protein